MRIIQISWGICAGLVITGLAIYLGSQEPSDLDRNGYSDDAKSLWIKRDKDGKKDADCFYAHPTTEAGILTWNIDIHSYAKGKELTGFAAGTADLLDTQVKAFDESCNMWIPRYRQMGMLAQGVLSPSTSDKKLATFNKALQMAVGDLKAAFEAFLETRPDKSRPFIIAGHSQGAILMTKVIADSLVGKEDSFVAAYLAGGYVPRDVLPQLGEVIHVCTGPADIKCVMSWDTRTSGLFEPQHLNEGMLALWPHMLYWTMFDKYCEKPTDTDATSKPRVQINPLTWSGASGAGKGYLGAKHYGEDTPQMPTDNWAEEVTVDPAGHMVYVADPRPFMKDAGPAAGMGNLHPADVTLWFYNIKDNVPKRIAAWREAQKS